MHRQTALHAEGGSAIVDRRRGVATSRRRMVVRIHDIWAAAASFAAHLSIASAIASTIRQRSSPCIFVKTHLRVRGKASGTSSSLRWAVLYLRMIGIRRVIYHGDHRHAAPGARGINFLYGSAELFGRGNEDFCSSHLGGDHCVASWSEQFEERQGLPGPRQRILIAGNDDADLIWWRRSNSH
jgi:hypothetical protein